MSVSENNLEDFEAGLTKFTRELTSRLNKKLMTAVQKIIAY